MARNQRQQQVGDQIQRELSELVTREVRDPRVGLVTLTGVDLSPDRKHAVIFFTCLDAAHAEEAAEGLNRAAGFLRSRLARRINMFTTPQLHFRYDESIERGAHLSQLINDVSRGSKPS